jgi:hypothetical protein
MTVDLQALGAELRALAETPTQLESVTFESFGGTGTTPSFTEATRRTIIRLAGACERAWTKEDS